MAWQKKDPLPHRDCIVCGEEFDRAERGWCAITCSGDCQHERARRNALMYRREHREENRTAVARYRARIKEDAL